MVGTKVKKGYVLLPTLVILAAMSLTYLFQARLFAEEVAGIRAVQKRQQIDTIQLRASKDFAENGQEQGRLFGLDYRIDQDQVITFLNGRKASRPLLRPELV
ncbi:hypothetical protein LQZ24_05340 [Fructobacillus sp. M1-13]|uniref:Uncharacterized protein n=1 Tax=Fructobacillus papyriferae TaxID=2713171 RepID=A0ABS5QPI9_9LACO|nr:hypothetical protein [Fructobacillus papyriferae]MBS9335094.1 hypothetical protein [Fructobacillus papyriferae]MCD2159420.1 hypothetical protein [Fructobacillus papyriferae]